jgi:hypothetical protein
VWLCGILMTAINFLLTYQQNCSQEKQSVPCGKYFSSVVFICFSSFQNIYLWNYGTLGVSEASDLFTWLRKFPAVMELEDLSLWWNSIQIYNTLGQCSFILMIVIFTKCIINLSDDIVTLHGHTFLSDYLLYFLSFLIMQMRRNAVTASVSLI